jgi:hypothetical protein
MIITPDMFPPNVKKIKFGRDFNNTLDPGSLLLSLTKLTFGDDFDRPLQMDVDQD